jgi:hypothetical protein
VLGELAASVPHTRVSWPPPSNHVGEARRWSTPLRSGDEKWNGRADHAETSSHEPSAVPRKGSTSGPEIEGVREAGRSQRHPEHSALSVLTPEKLASSGREELERDRDSGRHLGAVAQQSRERALTVAE